jgi:hypothetical protein
VSSADNFSILLLFCVCVCVGEGFLEGLLMAGWLAKLVHISGSLEDSVASWTLTKSKEWFLFCCSD